MSRSLLEKHSPSPAPTGAWTSEGGTTILYEVIVFSIAGGLVALVLIHYIALYLVKRQKKRTQERFAADAEVAELNAARGTGPPKQRSLSAATSNSGAGSSEASSRSGSGSEEEDELI